MKGDDKILIAQPGYYPPIVRGTVRRVTNGIMEVVKTYQMRDPACEAVHCRVRDEGLTWARGHDRKSDAAKALIVASALART